MKSFDIKTKIFFGDNAMDRVREIPYSRILIVTDKFFSGSSMLRIVTQPLSETNKEFRIFNDVVPDPPVEKIVNGVKVVLDYKPDCLIAVGGGSVIDSAKAIREFAVKMDTGLHIALIAIPTTSGTGSEVTAFSVITDTANHMKYPLVSDSMLPDEAILDEELVKSVPPNVTADTGMDVLTHAIEAYVSTANCDFTDPLALHAIKMIQRDLVGSYNGDMEKRDSMHNAQCLAGMAFSNALLGIVHSMAHKTGAAFADYGAHIIHGAANAMYLPKVIAFNAKDETAKKRYGEIADFMGLGGGTLDEKVALLITYLRGMNDDLKIPHCIKNYGADSYPTEQGFVPEEVFLERLPEIAANAILDACTGSNPRQPSQEEMEKLLKCCYYDTEVDF